MSIGNQIKTQKRIINRGQASLTRQLSAVVNGNRKAPDVGATIARMESASGKVKQLEAQQAELRASA